MNREIASNRYSFADLSTSDLMSNPEQMASLMNNPRLREMAQNFGGGGASGMPDIGALLQDPNMAEM